MKIENNHYNISFPQIIIAAGTRTPSKHQYEEQEEEEDDVVGGEPDQLDVEQRISFKESEEEGTAAQNQITERYGEQSNFEEDEEIEEESPQVELVQQTHDV